MVTQSRVSKQLEWFWELITNLAGRGIVEVKGLVVAMTGLVDIDALNRNEVLLTHGGIERVDSHSRRSCMHWSERHGLRLHGDEAPISLHGHRWHLA